MMFVKPLINEYFSMSKGQARAAFALVVLILIFASIYYLLPSILSQRSKQPISKNIQILQADLIRNDSSNKFKNTSYSSRPIAKLKPFKFNPNTLDSAGFIRLGLPEKLVKTILNYRSKGAKFYNKESLHRIYGLKEEEYQQLENFIDIPNPYEKNFENKPKIVLHINLNKGDTNELKKLRGIGSKLASNIVKQREYLGGFAKIEQLKEVYGISPETFEIIKSSLFINLKDIKTINLNEATFYEINVHPYLKGEIAKAIVDYRKSKDYKIDNLNQLKEISLINDEIFRKIVPYLSL